MPRKVEAPFRVGRGGRVRSPRPRLARYGRDLAIFARALETVFGDATRPEILDQAGIRRAVHLIVALPHSSNRAAMVVLRAS